MNKSTINYQFAKSQFGEAIIASTERGVCYLAFVMKDEKTALKELQSRFRGFTLVNKSDAFQKDALVTLKNGTDNAPKITLDLMGTDFQLSVWQALLKIPAGKLSSYGKLAAQIKRPKAVRAVGTAVGQNPVSFIVPCHRVVPAIGGIGNYHWGPERKQQMIEWEAARS